ncbi:hypothetical protein SAMN05216275_105283 [Streptosporangium canum]|uniref:Ribbon-helix-helix protein, copG family n=1 Tax=Streptosporangium canum TaxID=324952 RepID=A0A1I3LWA8_9ACTN|nr:hypothetical protein [Streptosporangium canum]SFI88973.1 hypothetical protein SAMN05216275_105283 [Streptosporangium canum]
MGVLTVEIDSDTERVLSELTSDGRSTTDVIREAIHIAGRLRWMDQARTDAERLGNDPDDLAEIRAIRRELGDADAW